MHVTGVAVALSAPHSIQRDQRRPGPPQQRPLMINALLREQRVVADDRVPPVAVADRIDRTAVRL